MNNPVRNASANADPSPAAAEPDGASTSGGITPEIMAVIEEAVAAYLGRKADILSVKLSQEPEAHSSSWMVEGRSVLHESHNTIQRGH